MQGDEGGFKKLTKSKEKGKLSLKTQSEQNPKPCLVEEPKEKFQKTLWHLQYNAMKSGQQAQGIKGKKYNKMKGQLNEETQRQQSKM